MLALGGLWLAMDKRVQRGDWKIVTNAQPATPAPLAAPIFSLRRQPAVLAHDTSDRQLEAAVKPVTDSVDGQSADMSCFAASLDGRTIIADGADVAILPASNMKVVTAAVALEVLGPDFTFVTRANAVVAGDTVEGDLFLVGGGDPLLASRGYQWVRKYRTLELPTPLEALADQIAARVRRISGRVIGDESHFDTERYAPGWGEDDRGGQAGPLSALLVNDARESATSVSPSDEPALTAAQELASLLAERGVAIGGGAGVGSQPPGLETIGQVASAPLGQVVKEMLTNSDNNTAEMVLKEIGAARSPDKIGNRLMGIAVVNETLTAWGVPMAGVAVVDGSGLDRSNRLTCRALLSVLDHVGASGPLFDGLPIVGDVGTLDDPDNAVVFAGLGVDGKVRAKTGSLRDAKALSGFFQLTDGRQVTFSLIINGGNAATRGRLLWGAMVTSLNGFSGSVSPEAIAVAGT